MAEPEYIMCDLGAYAMLEAHVKFAGRDRRRIKREVNKALSYATRYGTGMVQTRADGSLRHIAPSKFWEK